MGVHMRVNPGWKEHLAHPVEEFVGRIGQEVATDAARFAPKRTGTLAASIESTVHGHGMQSYARITAHTHYSAPVEYGHHLIAWGHDTHRFVPPQPYLRPALYRRRVY